MHVVEESLIIFGGIKTSTKKPTKETFIYRPATSMWRQVVTPRGNYSPEPHAYHAAVLVGTDQLYVLARENSFDRFDATTEEWSPVVQLYSPGVARDDLLLGEFAIVLDRDANVLIVYGSSDSEANPSSGEGRMFMFNLASSTWSGLHPQKWDESKPDELRAPFAFDSVRAVPAGQFVVLFVGSCTGPTRVRFYNLRCNRWFESELPANAAGCHPAVSMLNSRIVLLHGGITRGTGTAAELLAYNLPVLLNRARDGEDVSARCGRYGERRSLCLRDLACLWCVDWSDSESGRCVDAKANECVGLKGFPKVIPCLGACSQLTDCASCSSLQR